MDIKVCLYKTSNNITIHKPHKPLNHRFSLDVFRAGRDETYVREVEMREYTRKRKENESIATNIINDLQLRLYSHIKTVNP